MRITNKVFRLQVYVVMALIVLFDEFTQLAFWPPPVIYANLLAGIRAVDILVVGMFMWLVAHKVVMCRRGLVVKSPVSLPIFLFMLAIPPSIVVSLARGSTGVFFAWKNLVLGAMFFYTVLNAFRTSEEARRLLSFVVGLTLFKAAYSLGAYALGYGIVTLDRGYVPMLDSPAITLVVLAGLYSLGSFIFGPRPITPNKKDENVHPRAGLFSGQMIQLWPRIGATLFLVLISLSRENWGIYAVGVLVIITTLSFTRRVKLLLSFGLVALMCILFLWSFSPSVLDAVHRRAEQVVAGVREPQIYTSVGQHLLDIVEAVRVIREAPLPGIGAGTHYETEIIRDWKPESYGVHNGLLHTWIKFGLLGALAYVAMFVSFARSGWSRIVASPAHTKAVAVAPFGTALGMWTMSFLFSPTPFESFQKSVLIFFCMSIVYALTSRHKG